MSKQHYGVYGLDDQPWQSGDHDHLCLCPGCRGLDQDDYEFLVAQSSKPELAINDQDVAYVWGATSNAPQVVLMEDDLRHTDDTPFCPDADCPCHSDAALFDEYIARPVREGQVKNVGSSRAFVA